MALQDLTPQLRTRLSRMERAVGWFVILAGALLIFGFAYYAYMMAQRKGWFKIRAPYYTMVDRATGLRVGDPVMLMGFEVGQITEVKPMPPENFTYNVYVEFEIKEPNYGYLWSDGSRAKVTTADLLGKRVLEVTKGSGGYPSYSFHPFHELTLAAAGQLPEPQNWKLAEDIYSGGTNDQIVVPALTPLVRTNLDRIARLGRKQVRAFDTREGKERNSMTAVWDDKTGRYDHYARTNLYWLFADESPAVTERLEELIHQVEQSLPGFLALTNQLGNILTNTATLTSNLNAVASEARPAATNLAYISSQLREPGSLGEWFLGTNANRQAGAALENANTAITRADTNLTVLAENLTRSLDNLAGITSNLNAQVQSNTNILAEISAAVVQADEVMQGLKRHWLLRSAFRTKTTNAPAPPRQVSPKERGRP